MNSRTQAGGRRSRISRSTVGTACFLIFIFEQVELKQSTKGARSLSSNSDAPSSFPVEKQTSNCRLHLSAPVLIRAGI